MIAYIQEALFVEKFSMKSALSFFPVDNKEVEKSLYSIKKRVHDDVSFQSFDFWSNFFGVHEELSF